MTQSPPARSRAVELARRCRLDLLAMLSALWQRGSDSGQYRLESAGLWTREQLVCNILNLE